MLNVQTNMDSFYKQVRFFSQPNQRRTEKQNFSGHLNVTFDQFINQSENNYLSDQCLHLQSISK